MGYYSAAYAEIYIKETSNTYDAYIYCYSTYSCRYLDIYHYGAESKIYVYPTDCKTYEDSTSQGTYTEGIYCPSFTSASTMTEDEFKAKAKAKRESADDYMTHKQLHLDNIAKEEEEHKKNEQKREERVRRAEKETSEAFEKAEEIKTKDFSEIQKEKVMAADVNVGKSISKGSFSVTKSIYGSVVGGASVFVLMACYYAVKGNERAKYQPLLS